MSYFLVFIITNYIIVIFNNYKLNKEITKINKYMDKVLNGDYSIDIRDYNENKLSLLKMIYIS